jgi:hypothetical protein
MQLQSKLNPKIAGLNIALFKALGFLSLFLLLTFPSQSHGELLFLKSDEFKFSWPLPSEWEETQSLTKGQYALKLKGDKLMTLVLFISTEDKMTLPVMLNLHSQNPQWLFGGIKARFPESTFISSAVVKIGSHDAVQTQMEYTVKNLDSSITIYACHHTTIWRGLMFSLCFECLPENRVEGLKHLQAALVGFSFSGP